MARNITVNTEVTGEASFRQAMSQISDSLRVVKSEMSAASAEFAGQENSMEALTAKHDSLTEKLQLEQAKVEALRQAMEESAASTGENSSETMKLTAQYNNARAAMLGTQNELSAVASYMEEAASSADGCATSIDEYGKKVKEAQSNQGDMASDAPGSFDAVAQAILDSGIADKLGAIAGKLNDITLAAAAYADNIITLSAQMGVATDTVQALQYSAELVDVSVDTVAASMRKTTRAMDSAKSGTGSAASAFETLGVSISNQDGTLRNSETVFWEVVDALGSIENPTERDAIAMELFGRNAQTLNPLINAGAAGMAQFRAEAEQMGYILSDSELTTLGGLDDAAQRFSNATTALQNSVGLAWAPILTEITDAGTAAFTVLSNIVREHPVLTSTLGATVTSLAAVGGALLSIKAAVTALKTAGILSASTAAGISAGIAALAGPLAMVTALLSVGTVTAINYFDSLKQVGLIDETAGLEEMKANVDACNQALDDFHAAWGEEPTAEWADATFYLERELEAAAANAQAQYDAALAASEAMTEGTTEAASEQEILTAAIDTTTEAVNALIEAYDGAYKSAYGSIRGTLGMFNELDTNLGKSTKEVVEGWDAQTDAVSTYTENLQTLRDSGLSESLVMEISSGSLEDMKLAQQFMMDLDAGNVDVDAINAQWEAREQAMADYAAYVAEHSTEVEDAMQALVDAASAGADDMDVSAAMSESAANTIQGYVDGLDGGPIKDKMIAIAAEALAAFNGALGIASPSRRMREAGHWTVAGFTEGVEEDARSVEATMASLANTAAESFDTQLSGLSGASAPAAPGGDVITNIYVQEMTEAQTDYLVNQVNRRLGL